MIGLGDLKHPARGARHRRKRIGRGAGSGHGKTACRGLKGQKSRSGFSLRPGFEGGQMPLVRRIPKRGFTNIFRKGYVAVNLLELDRCFDAGARVTVEALRKAGLVKGKVKQVKILGRGELTKSLVVEAHAFSSPARQRIKEAGGEVIEC